jgi:serine/threonine-protein kinase RsbW
LLPAAFRKGGYRNIALCDPGKDFAMNALLDRPITFWKLLEEERLPRSWQVQVLSSCNDVSPAASAVVATMTGKGYAEADLFETALILTEALTNAVKHGNQDDPSKRVVLSSHVASDRVLIEIEDEGSGFDLHAVPDPTLPENLERSSGRGILLMRYYSTWMRFNERGNRVTLCKVRKELGE